MLIYHFGQISWLKKLHLGFLDKKLHTLIPSGFAVKLRTSLQQLSTPPVVQSLSGPMHHSSLVILIQFPFHRHSLRHSPPQREEAGECMH